MEGPDCANSYQALLGLLHVMELQMGDRAKLRKDQIHREETDAALRHVDAQTKEIFDASQLYTKLMFPISDDLADLGATKSDGAQNDFDRGPLNGKRQIWNSVRKGGQGSKPKKTFAKDLRTQNENVRMPAYKSMSTGY